MRMLLVLMLLAGTSSALVGAQGGSRQTVWSGTVGQRQIVIEERWSPPFTDSLLSVRVSVGGRTSTIEVSTSGRSPDLVVPWASERLVIISAEMASIVDLASELVLDQFLVARPSISPDGRFIAYRRFQPAGSPDEDLLLVYDVSSNTQVNRLRAPITDAMRDVGLPVFPEWHAANQKYRRGNQTPDTAIETLRSPVAWATDTAFVFLSGRGESAGPDASLAIHHVRVRGAGQPPVLRSQTIDAPFLAAREIRLLDCTGSTCQVQIEWAPAEGVRAQSLQVTF